MSNILHIDTTTYLAGDTHALLGPLMRQFRDNEVRGSSIIILGDVGLGFDQDKEEQLLRNCDVFLSATENDLYLIRGNHDKPSLWQEGGENAWSTSFQHIHFVPDGQLMMIQGKRYVALGGAISVDRSARELGVDYWADEEFTPPTGVIAGLHGVLAHTGPFFPGLGSIMDYIHRDHDLRFDLAREEDAVMSTIALLQPAIWYCGHFHRSQTLQVDNTFCRCLDIGEIYQLPAHEPF